MNPRLGALFGLAFSALLVAGVVLGIDVPFSDEPDEQVISYFEDGGNQTRLIVAAYAYMLAGLALLAFVRLGLRDRLRGLPGTAARAATGLGMAACIVVATALGVGGVAGASVALGNAFQDVPVDAQVARTLSHLGYASLYLVGGLAAACAITAFSWAGWRTGALPSWLVWLGYLASLVLLFAIIFLPLVALPVWSLVTSIWLLGQTAAGPPPARAV